MVVIYAALCFNYRPMSMCTLDAVRRKNLRTGGAHTTAAPRTANNKRDELDDVLLKVCRYHSVLLFLLDT